MPELPEVETIVRGLRSTILGKKIKNVNVFYSGIIQGKELDPLLNNDTFLSIKRHGKYILITTRNGAKLVIHLRMTGQIFVAAPDYTPDKHVHLMITFNHKQKLIYRDIRKFGKWIIVPRNKTHMDFVNAGTDALQIDRAELSILMKKNKNKKIKAFLLDQTALAGIGNIYADEICFALGIDPETPVSKVAPQKLLPMIKKILLLAIKNKGTSVSDYVTSSMAKGNFQNKLTVYKQKKCRACGNIIIRKKVAGRTSHVCPRCQK